MKRLLSLFLAFTLSFNAFGEVVCEEATPNSTFQKCHVEESSDPQDCNAGTDPIATTTTVDQHPVICNNESLVESTGHTKEEMAEIKNEYQKLCKKKAKAYKKALMGNLLKKGKIGQLVQALFHKKKSKANFVNGKETRYKVDANQFEGKSEREIEDMILADLEKQSGIKGLKNKSQEAQNKPEFKNGFHQNEDVAINVVVKTQKQNSCQIEIDDLPKLKETPLEVCEFCVEKNISSSFTNDCSYMVNSKYSEAKAQKLLNVKEKSQYCNHEMAGEENDLTEVEKMTDRLCAIAQSGLKPDFTIETSRNQYHDKTPELAASRGKFIQKYIRNELMNGVNAKGEKRCDFGDDVPDWLGEEALFSGAVKVKHPYYKDGKEGDYGPSPYAAGDVAQKNEIENLRSTLETEKLTVKKKNEDAVLKKADNKATIDSLKGKIAALTTEYITLSKSLNKIKQIDESVFESKRKLQDIAIMVQQYNNKINETRQASQDLDLQITDFSKKLSTIDADNLNKVTLLGEYYKEKNTNGDALDKPLWDTKLFNSFKMVRITGRAVEDNALGLDPNFITPAVNIAMNALVEVDNFTCVVQPIETHKTTLKGILKGGLKVVTILATPVVLVGGAAAAVVAAPFTFVGSFMCDGCGKPGNIPPVLRFGNPRSLNLGPSGKSQAKSAIKSGWKSYSSWGGLLDIDKDKNSFDNSTQEVYDEQQERLSKKK